MKRICYLLILLLCTVSAGAQVSFGDSARFNDGWLFSLSDDSTYVHHDYDDSQWKMLNLPHDWSIEGQLSPSLASCTGYLPGGIGWYRKHFEVTDTAARHYIYFEGIYNRSKVYLNGHLLGERPNGYVSFMYDMTPYLLPGENILAVRVDHSRYADSRWYTGSGIYRDVWMISAPETHISQWGIGYRVTRLTDRNAVIAVDVTVDNAGRSREKLSVKAFLTDETGKIKASASGRVAGSRCDLTMNMRDPKRWDINSPYLYSLHVDLYKGKEIIDSGNVTVGLRTLHFDPDKGFALNGRQMKVKGVCLHHDAGTLGAVVPPEVLERRLRNLKSIGVNAIRCSHNPQAPVFYDLCDRLGLLVMDEGSDEWEFPKRKWLQGWNVGTPGFDGSYDFFEEWIERDVTDMVRRDRNHPSIFLWSVGNEVDYPNDPYSHPVLDGSSISQPMYGGYNPEAPNAERIGHIAKRLAACIRAIDKSRPVTGALAGVVMSNETEYPDAIDVVGYNYTESQYDQDHEKYPERIIYGSENRSDYYAWTAVRDNDFIFGQFIWTGADYLGESGRWPSRGLNTGLLDFCSFTKPRGHFRASLWCDNPVAYIGTYPTPRPPHDWVSIDAPDLWNYDDGQSIRVVCYTNAPQARLLLNGQLVGEMKPYDMTSGVIYWDIPYSPGILEAEACDESGHTVARYSITTSGRPYALRATVDRDRISADGTTVHVTVEVIDEEGHLVKLADNNIRCTINGPAHLLGLESGSNTDMTDYTDNVHRAYGGHLLAYIRATGTPGEISVTFTSPLLKPVSINISAY